MSKSQNEKMSKDELIKSLEELVMDQTQIIAELQKKLETSKHGRKSQVLDVLREFSPISIMNIAQKLNISTKNVSSQLTYLRSDGYMIFTDNNGLKFLKEDSVNETK